MRASGVGRVEQVGVAGRELGRVSRDDRLHRGAHRAQVHRQVRRVGDEAAVAVEQRAGEVEALLDVHGARRVGERGAHLLGDRHEEVVEDLEEQWRALGRVGRGGRRRREAPQEQLAGGQHLGLPARLDDGRARRLADDRRPGETRATRQRSALVHRRLVPRAAGEHADDVARLGHQAGRRAPARRAGTGAGAAASSSPALAPGPIASTATVASTRPRPGIRNP